MLGFVPVAASACAWRLAGTGSSTGFRPLDPLPGIFVVSTAAAFTPAIQLHGLNSAFTPADTHNWHTRAMSSDAPCISTALLISTTGCSL
jgi:hypothetical protein